MLSVPISAIPQTPNEKQIKIVQALPDGDYVVAIDGVEYRAVTAEHSKQILTWKVERDGFVQKIELLNTKVSTLESALNTSKLSTQLAETKAKLEIERAEKFKALYEGEKGLREQAESLRRGGNSRVSRFFENPKVQIGLKIFVPTVQTFLASRQCR